MKTKPSDILRRQTFIACLCEGGQGAQLDTRTNEGRDDLPVVPNLSASERSDAGGNAGQNIAPLVLADIWAAQQRRPTLVRVSSCVRRQAALIFAAALLAAPASRADIVYVSNRSNYTIEKFTSGGVGSLFANTGLLGPAGLAFDSAGNLYAANQGNNTIEKFSSTGTDLGVFANTGLSSPGFFGLTDDAGNRLVLPIPEPSAWALLAAGGAALLGFRRWKRVERKSVRA